MVGFSLSSLRKRRQSFFGQVGSSFSSSNKVKEQKAAIEPTTSSIVEVPIDQEDVAQTPSSNISTPATTIVEVIKQAPQAPTPSSSPSPNPSSSSSSDTAPSSHSTKSIISTSSQSLSSEAAEPAPVIVQRSPPTTSKDIRAPKQKSTNKRWTSASLSAEALSRPPSIFGETKPRQALPSPPISVKSTPHSPFTPRLISIQDGQWVNHPIVLVHGQVGPGERPMDGTITVHHHLGDFPSTQWPVSSGFFKALVHLEPGPNKIRFEFNAAKISCTSMTITIQRLPLTTSPPLQLVILLGSDSKGEFDCPTEKKSREGNDLGVAIRKFRMAGYLWQAMLADQLARKRLGCRTFRLEEEWVADSLSKNDGEHMRTIAKVHVVRSSATVRELQEIREPARLHRIVADAIEGQLGKVPERNTAVLVLDANHSRKLVSNSIDSAFTSGYGICGSKDLHALPAYIEDVANAFLDCNRNGGDGIMAGLSADPGAYWEMAASALGGMMDAALGPLDTGPQRDFSRINRTFVTREPCGFRQRTNGLKLCTIKDEVSWSRRDCLRFRFHPCFRIPTDPLPSRSAEPPQVYAVENGLLVRAKCGMAFVEIYTGGVFRHTLEFLPRCEQDILLRVEDLRAKLPREERDSSIALEVFSTALRRTRIPDFEDSIRKATIRLPNGQPAFESPRLGIEDLTSQRQTTLFNSFDNNSLNMVRIFRTPKTICGIEFTYDDLTTQVFGKQTLDEEPVEFVFNKERCETLIGFNLWVQGDSANGKIESLEVVASTGRRSIKIGECKNCTSILLQPPQGRVLVGIVGRCSDNMHSFSILYKCNLDVQSAVGMHSAPVLSNGMLRAL